MADGLPLYHDEKQKLDDFLGNKQSSENETLYSDTGPGRLRVFSALSSNHQSNKWVTYQLASSNKKKIIVSNPLLWFHPINEDEWRLWRALFAMGYEVYIWNEQCTSAFALARPITTIEELQQIKAASAAEIELALAEQGYSSSQYHIFDLVNYHRLIKALDFYNDSDALYQKNNLLNLTHLPYQATTFDLISQATEAGKGIGFKLDKTTPEQLRLLSTTLPNLEKLFIHFERDNKDTTVSLAILQQFKQLKSLALLNWYTNDSHFTGFNILEELSINSIVLDKNILPQIDIDLPKLKILDCTSDKQYSLMLLNANLENVRLYDVFITDKKHTINYSP
jgi:hypothetical protein